MDLRGLSRPSAHGFRGAMGLEAGDGGPTRLYEDRRREGGSELPTSRASTVEIRRKEGLRWYPRRRGIIPAMRCVGGKTAGGDGTRRFRASERQGPLDPRSLRRRSKQG